MAHAASSSPKRYTKTSDDDSVILKEGYLIKKGQNFKTWKKRWFTLKANTLVYHKADVAKGTIKVGDIEEITRLRGASSVNTGVEQLGSGFQIKLLNGTSYTMFAVDQAGRSAWILAIEQALNYIRGTSGTPSKAFAVCYSAAHAHYGALKDRLVAAKTTPELISALDEFKAVLLDQASDTCAAIRNSFDVLEDLSALVDSTTKKCTHAWTDKVEASYKSVLKAGHEARNSCAFVTKITQEEFLAQYTLLEKLGVGSFAEVYRCRNRETDKFYAAKCFEKNKLKKLDKESLLSEVEIMSRLRHPHVLQLTAAFETEVHYYLILELVTGKDLLHRIQKKKRFSEDKARKIMRPLLAAIRHCHQHRVVHRDLKLENILLATKDAMNDDIVARGGDMYQLKIADFGFAHTQIAGGLVTDCGSPWYVAPEILEGRAYDFSVDMWSLGVILYILLRGEPPFFNDNHRILFNKIKKADFVFQEGTVWDRISSDAKDLIRRLLNKDSHQRLSVEQALSHPWIVGKQNTLSSPTGMLKELMIFEKRSNNCIKQGAVQLLVGNILAGKRYQPRFLILNGENLCILHSQHSQKERLALRLADIVALRVGKDNPAQLLVDNRAGTKFNLQFADAFQQEEWANIIKEASNGRKLILKAETALAGHRISDALHCADIARRIKCLQKTATLRDLWCTLHCVAERAECVGAYRHLSFGKGHSSAVTCLAYSPSESGVSTVIVSGSMDSSLAVWDARTGHVRRYLRGHKGPINDVCFLSPTQCLSASGDCTAKLWDVTSGKCLCTYERHSQNVSVIAASKCRSIVITGSWDKRIVVWKPESGIPLRECTAHRKSVTALSINDDGTRAISGGADNWVVVWDLRSAVMLFRFMEHPDIITHTTVSAGGEIGLTASADGMVAVWNLSDGCLISHLADPNVSSINAHDGMVCSTFIDRTEHENKMIITVGKRDRTVKLWQMDGQDITLIRAIEVEPDEPLCAGYNEEGSTFVLGLQHAGVAQWVVDWTLSFNGREYGNTTAPKSLPTHAKLIGRQSSNVDVLR